MTAPPDDKPPCPARAAPAALVALLRERARAGGDRLAFRYLADEADGEALTYRELDGRAAAVATRLAEAGLRGERCLLVYPPGLEFLAAFFGCLYAGVVPVPVNPPRNDRAAARFRAVAADCGAAAAAGPAALVEKVRPLVPDWQPGGAATWVVTDRSPPAVPLPAPAGGPAGDALAYLQYTSGSTGTPRGVMVTQAAAAANLALIDHGFGGIPDPLMVLWLPHFHDMGLVSMLYAMYAGMPCVLLPPTRVSQDPLIWLRAVSLYRATISGGPNFAFQLCADRAGNAAAGLDLRCWKTAYCGSEPVRRATLEAFHREFAPAGFDRAAFHPCYGMAEATLAVTLARTPGMPLYRRASSRALAEGRIEAAAGEGGGMDLVGCGGTAPGHAVQIVEPGTTAPLPDGRVGEILVGGPSMATGYWGRPAESRAAFDNRLPGDARPYFRTGDLGAVEGGQLFVTGRLKELIIVRGRNLYPQDLEEAAQNAHPALARHRGAAFAVDGPDRERVVLVNEVDRIRRRDVPLPAVLAAVQAELALAHDVQADALVLVHPGEVPRTSSGKIRRGACRDLYLAGELRVVAAWDATAAGVTPPAPRPPLAADPDVRRHQLAAWLGDWVGRRTGGGQPAGPEPIARFGLDSMAAVELHKAVEDWLGRPVPVTALWEHPTLDALAAYLAAGPGPAAAAPAGGPDPAAAALHGVERLTDEEVWRQLGRRLGEPGGLT